MLHLRHQLGGRRSSLHTIHCKSPVVESLVVNMQHDGSLWSTVYIWDGYASLTECEVAKTFELQGNHRFPSFGCGQNPCRTANMHTFGGLIRSLNAWPWCLDSRFVLNSIVGSKSTSRKGYRLQRTHHIELELDCPVKKGSSSTAKRLPFLLPWKFPFDHCLDLVFV